MWLFCKSTAPVSACVSNDNAGRNIFIAQSNVPYKTAFAGTGCENAFINTASISSNLIRASGAHAYGNWNIDVYENSNELIGEVWGYGILHNHTVAGIVKGNIRVFSDVENKDNYRCYVYLEIPQPLDKHSLANSSVRELNEVSKDDSIRQNITLQGAMQLCEPTGFDQTSKPFGKCVISKM